MNALNRNQLTVIAVTVVSFIAGISLGVAFAREPAKRFAPLLSSSKTVMDEQIIYPAGAAKITTGILTLDPGDETGWHTHGAPLTGIVLDGELTVDYGGKGNRIYKQGESIAETMSIPHNGKSTGTGPMRLFVVFIGAEGVANTTPLPKAQ
jgi:quercetin dioxygenase-like cupin family protein